ncbi:DmsC/YnfH family molybdoenzyme membrane anchor subunit [Escherichia coli]
MSGRSTCCRICGQLALHLIPHHLPSLAFLAPIACAGGDCAARFVSGVYSLICAQASALVPDYASLQVWRVVLLCAGLGCWLCPLIRRREPHVAGLIWG